MTLKQQSLIVFLLCTLTLPLTVSPSHAYWGSLVRKLFGHSVTTKGTTIGGSSKILRAHLKKAGLMPDEDYAAHHIIPVALKDHRVLKKITMDMDKVENGIALPTKPSVHPTLPLHRGNHPEYTAAVARELDQIPDSLSVGETARRISIIQQRFRDKLEAGIPLHPKYRDGPENQWYK